MRSEILLCGAMLWAGCDFEAPIRDDIGPPGNVISGTLIANGVDVPGDTMVLVFDAANPGPPVGTGSPVTIATVPAAAYSGDAVGLESAPFDVTGLPDGTYLVQALMDLDGDFNPFDVSVSGATCGDIVGAHVTDLVTATPAPVTVSGGVAVDDVAVPLGTVVPIERPAFVFPELQLVDREASLDPMTPQTFSLSASAIHTAFGLEFPVDLSGPCPEDSALPGFCDLTQLAPCDVAFYVRVADDDGDGFPDLRADLPPDSGIPNIWPRVFLQYLGVPAEDGSGIEPPPEGEGWSAEAFPFLAEIGAFSAGLTPAPPVPFGPTVPMRSLSVTWAPVVRYVHPGGSMTDPATGQMFDIVDLRDGADTSAIPAGAWSVTVVSETGQTWTLPNAIATTNLSTDAELFDPASQAGVLLVQ